MIIDNCLRCCRKHLRKAAIEYVECRLGHPEKWDACLGNLAEAAEAASTEELDFAIYIREIYLKLDENPKSEIDFNMLFDQLDLIYQKRSMPCPKVQESH